ncbi:MAG: phosphoserine phosphatase SerB [Candidatus Methanoliparum thermophilum]|uniref:phosphoserine phosphatase n=2 Tax=Candidatus Methanoliparum TaxID=2545692 RepID=A0A520KRA0_METT2|nr:MAG: phosphoserine phosphatase SerB [Candidatus Methanoliparum thermophilum]
MRMIVFDLDGTLIDGEIINEFAKMVNKGKDVADITKEAMDGDTNYEIALKKRVGMLKGLKEEDLIKAIKNIPLMPGVKEVIQEAKKADYKVAIITGSFKIAADYFGRLLGADYIISNDLIMKNGVVTGKLRQPIVGEFKDRILEDLCKKEGISPEECIVVGDGANDIELFKIAGLSIAFNAVPSLNKVADIIIRDKNLTKIIPFLEREQQKVIDNLIQHKKALEIELETFKRKRDQYNAEKRIYAEKRDELNKRRVELLKKAKNLREDRDKVNDEVQMYKNKKYDLLKELSVVSKKIDKFKNVNNMDGKDINQIKTEIERLKFEQQTRVMTIEKERGVVKRISELENEYSQRRKEIEDNEELKSLLSNYKNIKNELDQYNKILSEDVSKAQELHQEMITSFKEAEAIRNEADVLHDAFINAQKMADYYHHKYISAEKDLKDLEEIINSLNKKKTYSKKERERYRANKITESVFENFKRGEKITTDDILLFQRNYYD